MSERQPLEHFVGPSESQRLMGLLQRGVTRRDILTMLMAGGMHVTLAGSLAGTRLALRHGAGFVRSVFIVVVALLIAKTAYDAFIRGG